MSGEPIHAAPRTDRRLTALIVLLAAGFFVLDLLIPLGVAGGIPYIAVILLSRWSPRRRDTWFAAVGSSVLLILGLFFSPEAGGILWMALCNRFLALFAIWVTAFFCIQFKRTEELVRASEQKYRTLFETAGDAIFTVQMTEHGPSFVDCNLAALEMFGYTREAIVGRSPVDLSPPLQPDGSSSAEGIIQIAEAALAGEPQSVQWVHRRLDGTLFDAEVAVNGLELQGGAYLHATVRDVTQRKRAEEMLRLTVEGTATATGEDFFRRMVQHLASALGARYAFVGELLDPESQRIGTVAVWAGGRIAENFEYDLAGAPCDNVVGQTTCFYEKDVQGRFPEDHLLHEMEVESYLGTPLFDRCGRPLGLLVVMNDEPFPEEMVSSARSLLAIFAARAATELQRVKAEAERENLIAKLEAQNAELERFTYSVSHDLKTPLITLKGFIGLIRDDMTRPDPEAVDKDLAHMSHAADKMGQLLDELLELTRVGRVVNLPQHVPLGELANEAVKLVAGRIAQGNVRVQIAPDLPVIFGDRRRLLEVMQNLLDNAVKYMGDQTHPRVEIGARDGNGNTVCYVRDNGIGIEPRYHERIFGLFNQLDPKAEGSGVGLALVKRIIEVHDGRIWVESEGLEKGSTFCFTLAHGRR